MKNIIRVLFFFFILLMVACYKQEPANDFDQRLTGLWKLQIMELRNSETGKWEKWRNGMQGYLLYDGNGSMALHLTVKGYQNTDLKFSNFTDTISIAALKHLTGSYVYIAKYSIDKKEAIVEHARLSHSNPAEWNKIVKRRFSFKGDTLVLTPVEKKNASLRLKLTKS